MKHPCYNVLFLILLFLLASLPIIFEPRFLNAIPTFYDYIPLMKEYGVRSLLSTSPIVQDAVQEFASKAILLYLTFAVVAFLLFSIKIKNNLAKWISTTLTALLIMGMIGFMWQPYKMPIVSYEATKKRPDIMLAPGDVLDTTIHFNIFQKNFKTHLDKAFKGELRVFIQPYFIGNFSHQVSISDHIFPSSEGYLKLYISPKTLKTFIESKSLKIHSKVTENASFALRVRDLNKRALSRQDTLSLNGRPIDLKNDSMLLLFGFETNDGKPLIAFY